MNCSIDKNKLSNALSCEKDLRKKCLTKVGNNNLKMQGSNGADISAVRLLAWYVKRSAISVLVCNKEKEKRTKKEKEITPSKKVAVCRLTRGFKRKKESSKER